MNEYLIRKEGDRYYLDSRPEGESSHNETERGTEGTSGSIPNKKCETDTGVNILHNRGSTWSHETKVGQDGTGHSTGPTGPTTLKGGTVGPMPEIPSKTSTYGGGERGESLTEPSLSASEDDQVEWI